MRVYASQPLCHRDGNPPPSPSATAAAVAAAAYATLPVTSARTRPPPATLDVDCLEHGRRDRGSAHFYALSLYKPRPFPEWSSLSLRPCPNRTWRGTGDWQPNTLLAAGRLYALRSLKLRVTRGVRPWNQVSLPRRS